MAYCTAAEVLTRVDTDMIAGEITTLIEESDAWLDLKINMASLTVPMQRLLSITRSSIRVFLKDPEAQELGDHSMDRSASLLKLNKMLDEMLRDAGGGIGMRYGYARVPTGYVW